MPGVLGDENVSGPPTSAAFANEPGLVPSPCDEGFGAPRRGSVRSAISVSPSVRDEGATVTIASLRRCEPDQVRRVLLSDLYGGPRPERRGEM